MPRYIALVHKDVDSCYGVSFPDWPGVVAGGDTIDEALQQAAEVLSFAAEDWETPGVDSSTAMIAMFKARLPGHEALISDMRTLALGRAFHGILAWDSFFHLDHD